MGSICSKLFSRQSPETPTKDTSKNNTEFSIIQNRHSDGYTADPVVPLRAPPVPPPLPKPIAEDDQSRVQLHVPIYVATQSYHTTKDDQISFEIDDEMKLIEEINFSELHVKHLRSGLSGIIPKTFVRLDVDTPLRLAIHDVGIIQRCLMQYNVPGAYLIRHSASNPNAFVLSISQYNAQHNTFTWNYLICINPSNNCFYFPQETELQNVFFSSFQQLIIDELVHNMIPMNEILPYSIEFDEEVWKIPFDELRIEQKIGEGQFGEVSRANWSKGRRIIPVAVKKLCIRGVNSVVKRETEAMKKLTNLHIVTLYGVSQDPTTNEILIVTELMENGDLKSWLKRLSDLPEYSILLRFAKHISTGMSFLERQNYVHRDLACRNILLSPCDNKVKIADFGLSTILDTDDTERRQEAHSQKLPTRWLAPELLNNQAAYSIKSDVWAFGIVLIELWLKGGDPYGEEHHAWIQSAVSAGYVHEKPADCPDDFYNAVICQCLKFQANDRPSFSALRELLEQWEC